MGVFQGKDMKKLKKDVKSKASQLVTESLKKMAEEAIKDYRKRSRIKSFEKCRGNSVAAEF